MANTEKKFDVVNNPEHYCFGTIETIDYIENVLGSDGCYDFCIGNALKYLSRAEHKGTQVQDLKKAIWYINHGIEMAEKIAKEAK